MVIESQKMLLKYVLSLAPHFLHARNATDLSRKLMNKFTATRTRLNRIRHRFSGRLSRDS